MVKGIDMTDQPYTTHIDCPTCSGLGYTPGEPDADGIPDASNSCIFCDGYGFESPKVLLRRYAWHAVTFGLSNSDHDHAITIAAALKIHFPHYLEDAVARRDAQYEMEF